ncbi:MAG: hypothetical protein AB7P69_23925 [Candidatus Binatia bacterium]
MEEKTGRAYEEIQLNFAFVAEAVGASVTVANKPQLERASRAARPRGIGKALTTAQAVLLEASLEELNEHLLLLFEFCEAAMTCALDLAPLRKEDLFSAEEFRSLRGIGQAQWLLIEAAAKRETRAATGKGKKDKKRMSSE